MEFVENVLFSADTKATIDACKKFGAEIEIENSSIIIKNPIKKTLCPLRSLVMEVKMDGFHNL